MHVSTLMFRELRYDMTRTLRTVWMTSLALMLAASAFAAPVELRLKDGTRWRGETDDAVRIVVLEGGVEVPYEGTLAKSEELYLELKTVIAGKRTPKIIFKSDIISIESQDAAANVSKPAGRHGKQTADLTVGQSDDQDIKRGPDGKIIPPKRGVFVLDMSGAVGTYIRATEIEDLNKRLNEQYGPGQIVVIIVNTNGGRVDEAELIDDALQKMQKDGHRVVAWIKKAISAGAMLSMGCQEIYFMTEGTCGSVTTLMGSRSLPEEQQEIHAEEFARVATRQGYSEHIARAMKMNKYVCSYDKDPVTGEVTFYGDKSGKYLLSDEKSNLTFNSRNALDCGFSKGTADKPEDLAKLLDLPEWYEVDQFGREQCERWQDTVKRAEYEIPMLTARFQYKNAARGDPVERLGTQIQLLNDAIGWWRRAPQVARNMLPPEDELERYIKQLRKWVSDIRRAQRR